MKKLFLSLLFLLMTTFLSTRLHGQTVTTMGTDFWFSFMDNVDTRLGSDMLKVYVSGPRSCYVTLANPNTGWVTSSTVTPGVVTTINVPIAQGHTSTSCQVMDKGLHLVSTDSVSVYTSIRGLYNYDVANVFPTNILRDEYMIVSYPSDRYGSCFNVIATEDSTWVDIDLSYSTNQGHLAGSTLSVFLPLAGKSYQVITPTIGDFSGTHVKSRNCKRIAVFHGDVCIYIPDFNTGHSCDHAEEQAVPTAYWGRDFLVTNSQNNNFPDRVRVTALNDSCRVYRNGNFITTLNAGQTYMYLAYSTSVVSYIHTSSPVSVNVFFASTDSGTGDPSMVTITPLEQMLKNVTFASFNTQYTTIHYVNIVTKSSNVQYLRLDGNSIASYFTQSQYNTLYSTAKIQVNAGSHTLTSLAGDGFTAYAFGLGSHESYAYSVGSNMKDLVKSLAVNDVLDATPSDTIFICEGDSIKSYVVSVYSFDDKSWDFGDGNIAQGDTVVHYYNQSGHYILSCILDGSQADCFSVGDTMRTHIWVSPTDTLVKDTLVCPGALVIDNEVISTAGTYSVRDPQNICQGTMLLNVQIKDAFETISYEDGCDSVLWRGTYYHEGDTAFVGVYQAANGCDSTVWITFNIHPSYITYLQEEGCDSVLYENDYYHNGDTTLFNVFHATNGCDSTVLVVFKTYPSYFYIDRIQIWSDEECLWRDGMTYSDETDMPTVHYSSIHGCDSSYQLHLIVNERPPEDSSVVWVPNVFTPDEETNSVFSVFSYDLLYAHVYIFTRWGNCIAEFDGLQESWDGTYKGKPCKEEAYVYLIEYSTKAKPNYKHKKVGTVLLLR